MEYLLIFFGSPYTFFFLITYILFFTVPFGDYVVDDYPINLVIQKKKKSKFTYKQWPLIHRIYSYSFSVGLFDTPRKEYSFTLALHALNCCFMYNATNSFMATILFLVSPVNNQVAIWLNGRRYALGVLCALLIWNYNILFIPLYVYITWIHVYAIMLPIMMLFTPYWWTVPIGLALMFTFGFKRIKKRFLSRKKDYTTDNELQKLHIKKIIIYIKSIGYYFFFTIFPDKPRMYHTKFMYMSKYKKDMKEAYSLNWDFFLSLGALCFMCYELFYQQNLWALWWLVFISQYCNIVVVTMMFSDRYCTLASIGLYTILAKYINMLPSPLMECTYVGFIVYYIIRYSKLFWAYKGIENFHLYHVAVEPDCVEPRVLMAENYLNVRDPFRSFAILKGGLKYRPKDFKLLITMAKTLFAMQNWKAGLQTAQLAKECAPLGEEELTHQMINQLEHDYEKGTLQKKLVMPGVRTPKPESEMSRAERRRSKKSVSKGRKK